MNADGKEFIWNQRAIAIEQMPVSRQSGAASGGARSLLNPATGQVLNFPAGEKCVHDRPCPGSDHRDSGCHRNIHQSLLRLPTLEGDAGDRFRAIRRATGALNCQRSNRLHSIRSAVSASYGDESIRSLRPVALSWLECFRRRVRMAQHLPMDSSGNAHSCRDALLNPECRISSPQYSELDLRDLWQSTDSDNSHPEFRNFLVAGETPAPTMSQLPPLSSA